MGKISATVEFFKTSLEAIFPSVPVYHEFEPSLDPKVEESGRNHGFALVLSLQSGGVDQPNIPGPHLREAIIVVQLWYYPRHADTHEAGSHYDLIERILHGLHRKQVVAGANKQPIYASNPAFELISNSDGLLAYAIAFKTDINLTPIPTP